MLNHRLLLVLFLTLICIAVTNQPVYSQSQDTSIEIIAHRGGAAIAPENTIAAIEKALDIGAGMIEIDVRQTKDSVVVVLHDGSIDRTTDGTGDIDDLLFDDLKDVDAGDWFTGAYKGQRIPTLEQVLDVVDGKARLLIEVKEGHKKYKGIEERIVQAIHDKGAQSWCIVQSFERDVVTRVKAIDPTLTVLQLLVMKVPGLPILIEDSVKIGKLEGYEDIDGIAINHRFINTRRLKKLKEEGLLVYVWTVNSREDMEVMIELGVDGIITDQPIELKKLLEKKGI